MKDSIFRRVTHLVLKSTSQDLVYLLIAHDQIEKNVYVFYSGVPITVGTESFHLYVYYQVMQNSIWNIRIILYVYMAVCNLSKCY